jgi:protein phosphatase/serine/threonine-protein phosphatase Stp1
MSDSGLIQRTASSGRFRSWAASHAGTKRTHNEDAFLICPDIGLWAVADGAGGHQAGEVAAGRVIDMLREVSAALSAGEALADVRQRVDAAHAWLRDEADRRGPDVMIATTVVILLARDAHFACLWAGDSRAYLLRDGALVQISRDHSLVQELVESGAITDAEAENHPRANIITRAVGADIELLELEKRAGELLPGDRILLCSDGLCKTLANAEIERRLLGELESPAEQLVRAALAAQAKDNITAVVLDVGVRDQTAPGAVVSG